MLSTSSPESFRGFTFAALGDGNFLQRFDATELRADFGCRGHHHPLEHSLAPPKRGEGSPLHKIEETSISLLTPAPSSLREEREKKEREKNGAGVKMHPGKSGATVGDSGVTPDGPDMGFLLVAVRIAPVQSVTNPEGSLPRFDKP
jgi:hypothetical protein